MTEYVGAGSANAVDTGYMTGRKLTIGGVRVGSTDFNGKLQKGSLATTVQIFYTETDRSGKKRILSNLPMVAGWNDRIVPAPNRDGFVAAPGATNPGPAMNSEWVLYAKSAEAAEVPTKLLAGSLKKLVGMEVVLTGVTLPERRKKSVDPDEKPREPRQLEVIGEVVTLPSENKEYKGLTDKEIDKFLEERSAKSAARRAARGEEDESPAKAEDADEDEEDKDGDADEDSSDDDDEDADEDETTDDDEDAADADADSDDDDDDEPAPAPAKEKAASSEAEKAARSAVKKLLTGKSMDAQSLVQKSHAQFANLDKKVRPEALKLVQSSGFLKGIGVVINGNKVKLPAA